MVPLVDDVVALALPVLYCSGTGGVAGIFSSAGADGKGFLEPPNDHERPALRKPEGCDLGVDGAITSVKDFLLPNLQSSWPLKSAEDGVVEALLCLDELSVELVFVVLDDPLPLVRSQPCTHSMLHPDLSLVRHEVSPETRVARVT